MSTRTYDKHGKLLSESDTKIPAAGSGPRNANGERLRGAEPTPAVEIEPAPAARSDAPPKAANTEKGK